ncbi:hypothetical protein M899_0649 [Bacteriovorax sp. BSW11_IV]|uniref:hypothetical protein n=1 Tax=Bacteriovorax sp. BSW11_IV TaxID=1353529 RepID=UPI00038A01D7|nr:hypothetical protein [Bacteriovorax sp. BSW11_IV]EQC49024.1 hypothetical protein M899_0649 [Bacteriovorax sp. BSW11_IV]
MRKLIFVSCLLMSYFSNAQMKPKRVALFDCAHMKDGTNVERIIVHQSKLGKREFYEAETVLLEYGHYRNEFKKVNKVSKFDERVLEFSNSSLLLKINKVREKEGKYWAAARLSNYDIHSVDWTCKDAL